VTDTVPAGLTIGTVSSGCTPSGQQVTCTIASGLAPNATKTFTIAVTPTANASSTVVNTASVSGGGDPTCPGATNCSSSVTTPVNNVGPGPSADLRIVKTGPASVAKGGQVVYTIAITNLGPDSAVNAIVSDPTPAGLTFVSSGAPCSTFPCNLGTLTSGQTVTISNVVFLVPLNYGANSIVNTASVASDTPDPTPNNNSSSVSTPATGGTPTAGPIPAPIDARWMLLSMIALLALFGANRARRNF
jgi:uncharacterized repeat protein (TIGR01451 family)